MSSAARLTRRDAVADASVRLRTRSAWTRTTSLFALVFGLIATACGASTAPAPLAIHSNETWITRVMDHKQISLSVPSNWYVGEAWMIPGSFADLTGSLSNQTLSPPCRTGGNTIECGPPLTALQAGGVLVEVWQNGGPGWTLDHQPGTATTVSGLAGRVAFAAGGQGQCVAMSADRTRTVVVAMPANPSDYFEIDICSRGVSDAVGARILESVQVTPTD